MAVYCAPDSPYPLLQGLFRSTVVDDLKKKADSVVRTPQDPNKIQEVLQAQTGMIVYTIQYRIQYTPPTEQSSYVWKAYGKPYVPDVREKRFGWVEIDRLIYQDPGPLADRLANGHLVLELMALSVRDSSAIRVDFEIVPVIEKGTGRIVRQEELMVARAVPPPPWANDGIIKKYRRQPARKCVDERCWTFVPVASPAHCMHHR
ncbi:hypothetical protein B0H16DRAFT_152975 [Mycena metata]|uniref:Uncharacterized protein n=1 Tax=Mycena metata TaxID=1033252 RepID=A0AAD7MV71_9AGAR|nr:hypothetical protein B0H16DRAFT_152975 [Mycena metata]